MVLPFLATSQARRWTVMVMNTVIGAPFYAGPLVLAVAPERTVSDASAAHTVSSFVALIVASASSARLLVGRKT